MKLTIKRKHLLTADPASPTGQPGKRELAKGKPTGNSGGSPTPTPVKHPEISKVLPDNFHAHGQPHPDDPDIRKTGPARHPRENRQNKKDGESATRATGRGTSHLVTGFRSGPAGRIVKQVKSRIGPPASHHRMRAEGQKVHATGQATSGSSSRPYSGAGSQRYQPGHPKDASQARISDHLASSRPGRDRLANTGVPGKTVQPRAEAYGTPKRFARLRMTPKRDRGGAS